MSTIAHDIGRHVAETLIQDDMYDTPAQALTYALNNGWDITAKETTDFYNGVRQACKTAGIPEKVKRDENGNIINTGS